MKKTLKTVQCLQPTQSRVTAVIKSAFIKRNVWDPCLVKFQAIIICIIR